jgi:glutathione S-transferase
VPAIRHGDEVVTEQVAIHILLGDLFPEAGMTPAVTDRLRGPYLRWLVYYAACFEPAVVDRFMKREPAPESQSPYGTYEQVMEILRKQLAKGPYILGDTFTVADSLWGTALHWTLAFEIVPDFPEFRSYMERITQRPAFIAAMEKDAAFAAQHEAEVEAAKAG